MRTRIVRALVVALRADTVIVGTAHTGFGQPGGDNWIVIRADH